MKETLLFAGITLIIVAARASWVFWPRSLWTTEETELEPLNLSEDEITQLAAFLRTLSGGVNTDTKWLQAP